MGGAAGLFAQPAPPPAPASPQVQPQEVTAWKVVRKKVYPYYQVELLQRWTMGKWPRIDGMKARITPVGGGPATEVEGTWMTPDPRDFAVGWPGGVLDMNGDGVEDLVLRNSSGGVHCCYNYVIYSLAPPLKKLGDIDMQDCGEQIRLADLNGDAKPEILSCDAKFTYLGNLPYSESPFPPAVYMLVLNDYERVDRNFKQVYLDDIQRQRDALAKAYRPAAALQIVTDYFLMGDETQAWQQFNALYQGEDKEEMKLNLLKKMGLRIPQAEAASAAPTPTTPNPVPNPTVDPSGSDALDN
jgi:hypothetical protein